MFIQDLFAKKKPQRHFFVYGIGNPSSGSLQGKYAKTRHNIGKQILLQCLQRLGLDWQRRKNDLLVTQICIRDFLDRMPNSQGSHATQGNLATASKASTTRALDPPLGNRADGVASVDGTDDVDGKLSLMISETWMNHSGHPLRSLKKHKNLKPENLLVIHDETEIPFGEVNLKWSGGHKGHNGLRSIIDCLGSKDFTRLRFGVGRPLHSDLASHVLAKFSAQEDAELPTATKRAEQEIFQWLQRLQRL